MLSVAPEGTKRKYVHSLEMIKPSSAGAWVRTEPLVLYIFKERVRKSNV
jgi:hypothetical protein